MKGPSFGPTPSDVNWYEMRKDFDKFVNQLRFRGKNTLEANSNDTQNENINIGLNVQKKPESKTALLHCTKETKYKRLETFIENMEKDLFNPGNVKIARSNLSKDEKKP